MGHKQPEARRSWERAYRKKNRTKIRQWANSWYERNNTRLAKRRVENFGCWLEYLKLHYGTSPNCPICGRLLQWPEYIIGQPLKKRKHWRVVHFDHRNGEVTKIKHPNTWLKNRVFNARNVEVFEREDFGILCSRCNAFLPTNPTKRTEKAERVISYIGEKYDRKAN